jgi:CRP-like cAMP-binding protein
VESGREYAAGQPIFSQGDAPGGMMYVVQEGAVDIVVNGAVVDTIGPGMLLGEIGLVDSNPRTASAIAKSACRVLPIDERRFLFLIQNTPVFALDVMRTMANRLRSIRGG